MEVVEKSLEKRVMVDTKVQVTFQEKSSWQKDGCLFCNKKATQEAFCQKGNRSSNIRCCKTAACKEKARQFALTGVGEKA